MIMAHPEVPIARRYCASTSCGAPLGRDPGSGDDGRCAVCGRWYSFVPKLKAGDRVGDQYEVVGCLARGGFGWIYLARDDRVGRDVVLKGVRDPHDRDARAVARAELDFLATVHDDSIVKIHNFIETDDFGYIVMEYVNGYSLRELRDQRRTAAGRTPAPLPATHAVAYILAVLPAVGYLHQLGLLYCDFKPDNIIVLPSAVKLIDLGGVRLILDRARPVIATPGYHPPELFTTGPSVAADLYTVGRTLAVLALDFAPARKEFQYMLPSPADHPVLERYGSFHRFLLRATAPEPAARFQSAGEMADELYSVLREMVAEEPGGRRVPTNSTRFSGGFSSTGEDAGGNLLRPVADVIPQVMARGGDPVGALAGRLGPDPLSGVDALEASNPDKVDLGLARTHGLLRAGRTDEALDVLRTIERHAAGDWRLDWYRGMVALETGRSDYAAKCFDTVYSRLPGELAPKIALAIGAELRGDLEAATRYFGIVVRTDPSMTGAAFGLARCHVHRGQRDAAVAAYEQVAASSSAYLEAQVRIVTILATPRPDFQPSMEKMVRAAATLQAADIDIRRRAELAALVLRGTLTLVEEGHVAASDTFLLGMRLPRRTDVPIQARELRRALEQAYLVQKRHTDGDDAKSERYRLVAEANRVRPWSLL
jgi:serine/threonine-protein kinase PknG